MLGIKLTAAKLLGGALVALTIVAVIGLAWAWQQYRGEIIKSGALEAKVSQLRQTNKENNQAIARMEKELLISGAVIARHRASYDEIKGDHDRRVNELQEQLSELREAHETIGNFLDTPVPAEYVRYRMLQEATGDHRSD